MISCANGQMYGDLLSTDNNITKSDMGVRGERRVSTAQGNVQTSLSRNYKMRLMRVNGILRSICGIYKDNSGI